MKKDILLILTVVLLIAVIISGTEIQSVDEYYLTHIDDIKPDSKTVFISISCENIYKPENYPNLDESLKTDRSKELLPPDGKILPLTEYVLRDGDTVYSILSRAVRYNKIQMEYQGARDNPFGSVYIQGINYLYEFSCGELSGWMYRVNGKFPEYGCSLYELSDGDVIEWVYTCDLGRDVGCEWMAGGGIN